MVDKLKGVFGGGSVEDNAQGETAERPKVAQPSSSDASDKLKGIFGGGEAGNDKDGDGKPDDFVKRYTTGNPNEGYTTEEAKDRFQKVMKTASPEQIQMALSKTVQNLPEDQRKELSQMIQDRQQGKNMVQIERTSETSPGAQSSGGLDDVLGGLLGGSGGGGLGDILGGLLGGASGGGGGGIGDILGGLLGGGSSDSQQQNPTSRSQSGATDQQSSGGGLDDLLGSILSGPQGKAIMGGIAAFAMQAMQGGKSKT